MTFLPGFSSEIHKSSNKWTKSNLSSNACLIAIFACIFSNRLQETDVHKPVDSNCKPCFSRLRMVYTPNGLSLIFCKYSDQIVLYTFYTHSISSKYCHHRIESNASILAVDSNVWSNSQVCNQIRPAITIAIAWTLSHASLAFLANIRDLHSILPNGALPERVSGMNGYNQILIVIEVMSTVMKVEDCTRNTKNTMKSERITIVEGIPVNRVQESGYNVETH
jgi:hypothetical protein